MKYSSAIQREFAQELESPSDEIVRLFTARVYDGRFTKAVRDEFKDIVSNAFKETIRELVNKRLTSALKVTSDGGSEHEAVKIEDDGKGIVTTSEEVEAFHIVKSIVRTEMRPDRIVMRDAKSYCAILLDDNNRKPVARLHFNKSKKYFGVFSNKSEERVHIETLEDIYDYAERLRSTVHEYDVAEVPR